MQGPVYPGRVRASPPRLGDTRWGRPQDHPRDHFRGALPRNFHGRLPRRLRDHYREAGGARLRRRGSGLHRNPAADHRRRLSSAWRAWPPSRPSWRCPMRSCERCPTISSRSCPSRFARPFAGASVGKPDGIGVHPQRWQQSGNGSKALRSPFPRIDKETNRCVELRTGEMVSPCSSLSTVGAPRGQAALCPHTPSHEWGLRSTSALHPPPPSRSAGRNPGWGMHRPLACSPQIRSYVG